VTVKKSEIKEDSTDIVPPKKKRVEGSGAFGNFSNW